MPSVDKDSESIVGSGYGTCPGGDDAVYRLENSMCNSQAIPCDWSHLRSGRSTSLQWEETGGEEPVCVRWENLNFMIAHWEGWGGEMNFRN